MLYPARLTPRELRHTFVSLMSDTGVPVEEIARLAGHTSTRTTEIVYRHQLRPVMEKGAQAMDQLFGRTA
jgi:integrase